jgi:hypothetical protein
MIDDGGCGIGGGNRSASERNRNSCHEAGVNFKFGLIDFGSIKSRIVLPARVNIVHCDSPFCVFSLPRPPSFIPAVEKANEASHNPIALKAKPFP